MSIEHEELVTMEDRYLLVHKLLNEKCKHDPPSEPYKSKYKARQILEEMKSELSKKMDDCVGDRVVEDSAKLAFVYFMLGSLASDVDELSTGEEYLCKTLSLLEDLEMRPECILIVLANLNQLGLLWSQRGRDEKAFEYLDRSEKLYHAYRENCEVSPTEMGELFTSPENRPPALEQSFEKTHTLTLYYLAQVYRTLEKPLKSAHYCHSTLRRQLESVDYDKIEWGLNSATLSQFLIEKNAFKAARHHLSAASYILDLKQSDLDVVISEEEQHEADKEQLRYRKSDLSRCWAIYCLNLLTSSKTRLVESDQDLPREVFHIPEELEELWFPSLELEQYESRVSCDFLLTFEDARPVFLFAQEHLKKAKEYYTLEEHVSDYISIQQDLSQLYLALAFFEDDESRQCKMHKRRIEILRPIVGQISPVHYLKATREIWYELAETYTLIMDTKYQALCENKTVHGVNKHNNLCQQAIDAYKFFINTFTEMRTGTLPETFPEDYERCALLSHVYSARLYTKFLTQSKETMLNNYKSALEGYKFVVDYCWKRPEAKLRLKDEYNLCTEMHNLLPYKMSKLSQELS